MSDRRQENIEVFRPLSDKLKAKGRARREGRDGLLRRRSRPGPGGMTSCRLSS
jgi:hypothetical protein